jgi:mannose-6-phosphate isomerase-like protein (cupin superfamily)
MNLKHSNNSGGRKRVSVFDCQYIHLQKVGNRNGQITAVNNNIDIPFTVRRLFYLYDIPAGENRGAHAHMACHQFLIAASGSFEVMVDDGRLKQIFTINQPNIGLHIPPGIWASERNFSSGAICLVLASHNYDSKDYIYDYSEYLKYNVYD